MADVTALFWDVGGVILSNGWDRAARAEAVKKFGLDWEEFQDRHELASPAFETGQITLDTYLQRTVFYRKRAFHAGRIHRIYFCAVGRVSGIARGSFQRGADRKISACHHQQ